MAKFDINKAEELTMKGLKDFQRETVERIDTLFRENHRRVLVADEVGMGKTLIARGAIVKTAKMLLEKKSTVFRVVYICSNISIALQNIRKLKVSDTARIEGVSDTRLSMQHLKIAQQNLDPKLKDDFIQLIPLTPDTSFRLTTGGGTVNERALMFAILRRMPEFKDLQAELENLFIYFAKGQWDRSAKDFYEKQVEDCEKLTGGKYTADLIAKIRESNKTEPVIDLLAEHLQLLTTGAQKHKDQYVLNKLRLMFARISANMLQPDLVIMDEFQRFKDLINAKKGSDTSILAKQFIESGEAKVLLLSATPYKLYSTLEEIEDARGIDEHYQEFFQVMKFLLGDEYGEFEKVWSNYSVALHEFKKGDFSILRVKNEAEDAMYGSVCRTERLSVMDSGDYTDESGVKAMHIRKEDIRSFLAMGNLLKNIRASFSLPVDYVKSCPYLMSFMKNYKVKQEIEKHFKMHPNELGLASDSILWVDPFKVNNYRALPKTNARLEMLKEESFENHAELYLWVPPSLPYYELQGAYASKNEKPFSKILVFSAWEMVPRMIGTMISYEAERLTVGEVCRQAVSIEKNNAKYYARRRYPYERLRFTSKTLFCLLYPSRTLSEMYRPVESLNKKQGLSEIEREIHGQIRIKLKDLQRYETLATRNEDSRWYYLAPMLMDGTEYVTSWISVLQDSMNRTEGDGEDSKTRDQRKQAFQLHIEKLTELLNNGDSLALGKMPDDLTDTLTEMALASPAVCVYRSNGNNVAFATMLAKTFLDYFNTTESIAVVQLASEKYHARKADDNAHWQEVLTYCKDGCFQAMFDEYLHLISESLSFSGERDRAKLIQETMLASLNIRTATYGVDTYATFKKRLGNDNGDVETETDGGRKMRAHYAVAFINSGTENKKTAETKDRIRAAFNSPLKPFVLATTSIGQEGLDFHYYCRKIMHWNLPGNPIDLEQREGRINRFKCLAIRQNVAEKYGDIQFQADIWKEMFKAAEKERTSGQSELVPYWCFGKDQSVKIERIVPMYPMSKDELSYDRLKKVLLLYRLTLGQARQADLLEYLVKEVQQTDDLKKLFIDLCPFSKRIKAEQNQNDSCDELISNVTQGDACDEKEESETQISI
nr:DEAD/DEAH box helicase family protein [Clostridia bacterium]